MSILEVNDAYVFFFLEFVEMFACSDLAIARTLSIVLYLLK